MQRLEQRITKALYLAVLAGIVLNLPNLSAPAQDARVPPAPSPIASPGQPIDPPAPSAPSPASQQPAPPYQPAPYQLAPPSLAPTPYMPPVGVAPPPPPPASVPYYAPSPGSGFLYPDPGGPDHHGFWTLGLGMYFMQPFFQANPAFVNGHVASDGSAVYRQTDFSQHVFFAPQFWLGYTGESGWGMRGRWFEFSSTAQASGAVGELGAYLPGGSSLSSASTGDVMNASSVLYGDVADFEATYTMMTERWWLIISGGVRYVHLNQAYSLNVFDSANGVSSSYSTNNFDGAGPTVSIEGHRQVGLRGLGFYGSARGSLVFGEAHQWADFADPLKGTLVMGGHQTSVLCISELETGVEWSRRFGRFRWWTQAGFVGQFWTGAGNATQALSLSTSNIAPGSNFGFIGGVLRGGFCF